jgi:hypothetical protein
MDEGDRRGSSMALTLAAKSLMDEGLATITMDKGYSKLVLTAKGRQRFPNMTDEDVHVWKAHEVMTELMMRELPTDGPVH